MKVVPITKQELQQLGNLLGSAKFENFNEGVPMLRWFDQVNAREEIELKEMEQKKPDKEKP